jgi:hypothetical protein
MSLLFSGGWLSSERIDADLTMTLATPWLVTQRCGQIKQQPQQEIQKEAQESEGANPEGDS